MVETIRADVGAARGFDELQRTFACDCQACERCLLVADAIWIERNGREYLAAAPCSYRERQMDALAQGHRIWRRTQQPFHAENGALLDHGYVRDYFGGGPTARSGRLSPAEVADFFSGGEEFRPRR